MKLRVEAYAHGPVKVEDEQGNEETLWGGHLEAGEVRDLTRWVRKVTVRHSTTPPWESVVLQLKVPVERLFTLLPGLEVSYFDGQAQGHRFGATGWWVVVRMQHEGPDRVHDWPAIAWGRVERLSVSLALGSAGQDMCALTIQVQSWLAWMEACDLIFTAQEDLAVDGGVFNLRQWAGYLQAQMENFGTAPAPGHLLEELIPRLWNHLIPETLAGGHNRPLWESVGLVHDKISCAKHAPLRLGQTLRVPGLALGVLGQIYPTGKLGSWLRSAFHGDPALVEWFPSLEFFGNTELESRPSYEPEDRAEIELSVRNGTGGRGATRGPGRGSGVVVRERAPASARPNKLSRTASILGANPVLVYRMRPTLTGIVKSSETIQTIAEVMAGRTGRRATYGQVNIDIGDLYNTGWYIAGADEIGALDGTLSDIERINAVNIHPSGLPGQEMDLWGVIGRPVVERRDARRNGVRALRPRWPFFSNGGESDGALSDPFSALNEIAYQMVSNNGKTAEFWRMRLVLERARPWVKAGHWWSVDLGARGKLSGLAGYGEEVTHELEVDQEAGHFKGRTTVMLSRATWLGFGKVLINEVPFGDGR